MPYFQNRHSLMVVFALVSVFAVNTLTAQNGDSLPQYEIKSFEMPTVYSSLEVHSMNNLGQIVGSYRDANTGEDHGFVYDPTVNEFLALDLNNLVTVPAGWLLEEAYDINDLGQIVGNLYEINGSKIVPFLIDLYQASGPELIELPDLGVNNLRGRKINNNGDVVVVYDASGGTGGTQPPDMYHFNPGNDFLDSFDDTFDPVLPFRRSGAFDLSSSFGNNPAQIAGVLESGVPFRYTLGDSGVATPNDLSDAVTMSRINDHGVIVGSIDVPFRRNKTKRWAFRYNELSADPLETFEVSSTRPQTLNNNGDFTISTGSLLYFYHEGSGFLDINGSALEGDPQLIDDWSNKDFVFIKDITTRGASIWPTEPDFPTMCGYMNSGGSMIAVVLIPFSPEANSGISVKPTSGLVTTEAGGQDSIDVVLNTQPTSDVTLGISSSNTNEGTVNVTSLTFTSANWDIAQTVTVTGVDDAIEDDDQTYFIHTAAATSIDPEYHGVDADDVSITNEDDDTLPGGGSETYSSDDTLIWEIPDNDSDGVTSTLDVGDHAITNLTVNLNIQHQRPSDVDVFLVGPNGTEVRLSNLTGDNTVSNFEGTDSLGDWSLTIIDSRKKKTGTLNSWSINVDYD